MTENILQSYVTHNLLDHEGRNEEFEYLVKSSEDLLNSITNQNVAAFALAAINPNVSIDNIQLNVLQCIILKEWKMFIKDSKQTDIQRTVLRATIFNTLDYLIDHDNTKAAIIWLSCQHVFNHIVISNKHEQKIIHNLIQKAGVRYNALAKTDFQIVAPKFEFDLSKSSSVRRPVNNERNASSIQKKIDISNVGIGGTNITTRVVNRNVTSTVISTANFQTWYTIFSSKLSTALEELTTSERNAIKKYLTEVDEEFESMYKTLAEEIPNQIEKSLHSLANNNNLIWWKETLFSKSLEESYRGKPVLVQLIAMAKDLAYEIDGHTPISVDYFLKETFYKVQAQAGKFKVNEISEKLRDNKNNSLLRKLLAKKEINHNSSWTLLDFLSVQFFGEDSDTSTIATMGIGDNTELTFDELLIWLFHDFQALKLAENG